MKDIISKIVTLREATAQAEVHVGSLATIHAVEEKNVPKGDVLEFAKVAALFAIKRTSDVIPDCHPLPIEAAQVYYQIDGLIIRIHVLVRTIYKTGVEVEAMHGASIAALTIYDMLKPIEKHIEIKGIRLVEKKGGKSSWENAITTGMRAKIVVCSDRISQGIYSDTSGIAVVDRLKSYGVGQVDYVVIPDEVADVRLNATGEGYDLILFVGGTGVSDRDVTPEAIAPLLDCELPGVMEAARGYGQQRIPYAMFSRGLAGFIGDTLILTLPGSLKGATETTDAVFPALFHILNIRKSQRL